MFHRLDCQPVESSSAYVSIDPIEGPYDIYFTSHDLGEPAHVHVDREHMAAKLWLNPVSVASNFGYSRHELRRIERLVSDNQQLCLRKWNEFFGT